MPKQEAELTLTKNCLPLVAADDEANLRERNLNFFAMLFPAFKLESSDDFQAETTLEG